MLPDCDSLFQVLMNDPPSLSISPGSVAPRRCRWLQMLLLDTETGGGMLEFSAQSSPGVRDVSSCSYSYSYSYSSAVMSRMLLARMVTSLASLALVLAEAAINTEPGTSLSDDKDQTFHC